MIINTNKTLQKNMKKEIIIENKLEEIAKIAQFIEDLGRSLLLPDNVIMNINLAIEETITNIMQHCCPTDKSKEITLDIDIEPGLLTFQIIYDGTPFKMPDKETTAEAPTTLDQLLSKELGILLIRRTMDEVNYESTDSKNILTLIKHIDTSSYKFEASMRTNLCKIEDVTILAIEGRLDTANAQEFNNVILSLLEDLHPNIIINCEGMTYISSSGLRCFITLQKGVSSHNGNLAIEAMKPEIKKIFDLTGCSPLFTIR